MKGWVKLYREQFNNPISKKPWCDGYAWSYLYSQANHKKGTVNFRNEYIEIKRGQFLTSKIKLEKVFEWTRRHTENFLKALKNDEMITYRVTNRYIVITIVNYMKYQSNDEQDDIQNNKQVANRRQTDDEQVSINKNVKNVKNVKKKRVVSIHFNYEEGKFLGITNGFLSDLKKRYPNCDVDKQFRKMTNWLVDNQNKKRQGKRAFIDNWMERNNRDEKERKELGIDNLQTLTGHLKE